MSVSTELSSPLTPQSSSASPATTPSDASLELSFDYEFDSNGNFIRVSKGSSNDTDNSPIPAFKRASLSRSESAPSAAAMEAAQPPAPARSFHRVASGSVLTPGSRGALAPSRKLGPPQRIPIEESQFRLTEHEEKENISRQASGAASSSRIGRPVKRYASGVSTHELPDPETLRSNQQHRIDFNDDASGDEQGKNIARPRFPVIPVSASSSLASSTGTRIRRSASLSDASTGEERSNNQYSSNAYIAQYKGAAPRPTNSIGAARPRRITHEEKVEQEKQMQHQMELEQAEFERREAERLSNRTGERQSPSPTHKPPIRSSYGYHQRRDSDTLRSVAQPSSGSPTAVDNPRSSPPNRAYSSSNISRHRRSPTSTDVSAPNGNKNGAGKSWGSGERDPYGSDFDGPEKSAPPPVQQQKQQQQQSAQPVQSRSLTVNKKTYARLDMVGKGGSSRVYRVLNSANQMFAIKRVSLDKTDPETMSGYMNEIALLKRLEGNNRIIRLMDSEVRPGPDGSKGYLLLVMELGEIDMAHMLQEQQKEPVNMIWIAYYWQQMLQAVHIIHEEKIVHSDLKPANFVLVKGQLKLIDFGIANAIANDTTNIQRDNQIGTVNYMSPEAIELQEGMRRLKVGRPSDVWSLGCILYQMVYGHPPFHRLSVLQKMKAIPDVSYNIDFPEYTTPSEPVKSSSDGVAVKPSEYMRKPVAKKVIATIKNCLNRNPKERATIPELLEHDWLEMKDPEPTMVPTPPSPPKLTLAPDEAVITPYFMRQLLSYAINLGQSHMGEEIDTDYLIRDSERLVAELQSVQNP